MDKHLDLTIWRDLNMVSTIRRFIEEVYEQVFEDLDAVSRIALSAHELLENAVKYSTNGPARIRVGVEEAADSSQVTIVVTNRAEAKHVAALRSAFGEMERATDPLAHYQTLMVRSAKRREGSGLGLARVGAEGEMTLSLHLDDDGQVSLRARTTVEHRRVS